MPLNICIHPILKNSSIWYNPIPQLEDLQEVVDYGISESTQFQQDVKQPRILFFLFPRIGAFFDIMMLLLLIVMMALFL
jgi:hypothetical protein